MGYQIFTGHRLESLVENHLTRFTAPFFGPRPLIVLQSQSLAHWLKLCLASRLGGYATGDFLFQDEALRRLLGEGRKALFLDELKFALYHRLATVLAGSDPVYLPLRAHGTPDPARLFELADHIAGVFHNYAMNSDLWPRALATGIMPDDTGADPTAFAWQSQLWRDLLGEQALAGVVLEELTRRPPSATAPPVPVLLVGSAFLSRRASAFLRAWADAGLIDVVHLLLLPARAETIRPGVDRRPWSSWGTFGRAFLTSFPPPVAVESASAAASALHTLQEALARGESAPLTPDPSLQVASCPHPLRELEALRDVLLSALAADDGLQVHEIAVLAPDINVYAPFLDAVFGSDDAGRNLRFHVIDLDLGRENTWFRALDALLGLVSGSMDRPTLFALVDTPAFREAWSLDDEDRDLWLDYTETVSAWREEEGDAPQSWSQSWERLFTGWFRPEHEVESLSTSPSAFRSLGRFHRLVTELRARARETRRPRSFVEWIRFLDQTMAAFLAAGDGTGAVLAGRLRTLVPEDQKNGGDELPWSGFRAFVQDQIAHFAGRRGQLLTEGIHCSSLKPLRAIPFKVIAVLGLDEGRFPHQVPTPSFDLRRHEPGQDEVSSLALDRYSFWETVMAAQSLLYLSYQGRGADGADRPPSPVLADLLDHLEESAGTPWPVNQVTVKDFSARPGETTWSPRTRRRAAALAGPRVLIDEQTEALPEPPSVDEVFPEVRTPEVVLAFTAPARFHLQRVLQTALKDEDRRGVDDEEPWSLTFLDRQSWLQEGLRRRLAGTEHEWDVDEFLHKLTVTGRVRAGVFSERDRRSLAAQAEQVRSWADELRDEGWRPGEPSQERRRWAGRPWAVEPGDKLVRGGEALLPRVLYSESMPMRTKFDASVRLLLAPAPARLASISPSGSRAQWSWRHENAAALTTQAEAYWREAAARPLPYYPDLLEAVAARRAKEQDEPWPVSLEESWRKVRNAPGIRSETTLTNCPYAALAFPEEPDWQALAADLSRWWQPLFVPLLEAWS